VKFKLYKLTLKCDDTGATPGVFTPNHLPFGVDDFGSGSANFAGSGVGTENKTANAPYGKYWNFFDQSSRSRAGGVIGAAVSEYFNHNIDGRYDAPVGTLWHSTVNDAGPGTYDFESDVAMAPDPNEYVYDTASFFRTPLSFIFPALKRKLKIRCVARGRLRGLGSRAFSFRNRIPKELKPNDWISDNKSNFIGNVSHFYFIRAVATKATRRVTIGFGTSGGRKGGTAGPVSGEPPVGEALPLYQSQFITIPAQLQLRKVDTYSFRAAGDGKPSFRWFVAGMPPPHPNKPTQVAAYWLNNSGFIECGDATNPFFDQFSIHAAQDKQPAVPDGFLTPPAVVQMVV